MGKKIHALLRAILILSFCILFLMVGCKSKPEFTEEELALIPFAQTTGLPAPSGGFVLSVNGETITSDEIVLPLADHFKELAQQTDYEQFKVQAKGQLEQFLVTRISNIILYQLAQKELGENFGDMLEKIADAEVRKFIVKFEGDTAKAEQALKEMGMDWVSYKEYQKRIILTQSYIHKQLPEQKPITHSELVDTYESMKSEFVVPPMIQFQLIDIQPDKLQLTGTNEDSQREAKQTAEDLIIRLKNGADFSQLAEEYSHGPYRKSSAGIWKPVQPDNLVEPYDAIAKAVETMEVGEISEVIDTGKHVFIVKLLDKQQGSNKTFEEVQGQLEEKISFERRRRAIDEIGFKLIQQAAIGNKDAFAEFCLKEIYRRCTQ